MLPHEHWNMKIRVQEDLPRTNNKLREKCPYSKFFWFAFYSIWIESGEIRSIAPYSVQIAEKYGPEKLQIRTLFMQ